MTVNVRGAANLRDVGGLPTADGQHVRPGRLLRSDSLTDLDGPDVSALVDDIGVRLVIDLRAEREAERDGRGPVAEAPVRYVNLPLGGIGEARVDVSAPVTEGDLALHYVGYQENGADSIVAAVRLLSGTETAVVHCSAGKDRTGIVVALVLDALGVPHEEIVTDYAATAANMPSVLERLRRSPTGQRHVDTTGPASVLGAEPETMRRFLRYLDENGGAAVWLVKHGLSDAELDALRRNLLS